MNAPLKFLAEPFQCPCNSHCDYKSISLDRLYGATTAWWLLFSMAARRRKRLADTWHAEFFASKVSLIKIKSGIDPFRALNVHKTTSTAVASYRDTGADFLPAIGSEAKLGERRNSNLWKHR